MKIHLTAIGGTGMGALAGLLSEGGCEIRGSDGPLYPPMSSLLEQLGIPLYEGYAAENLDWGPGLVVLGNTCSRDHVEYKAALQRGLRVVSFPELLGERFLQDRHSIVIAGTHGKTTTSSLVAHLLDAAGLVPGFLIGGIPANFGRGFRRGAQPYFVVEGDEYDSACFDKRPKFVHYRPKTVVLTGVEFDHADIYDSIQQIERAFASLIRLIPHDGRLIVDASCPTAVRLSKAASATVETYNVSPSARGQHTHAIWYAAYTSVDHGLRHRIEVSRDGVSLGVFEVGLSGAHNMRNVLAAVAVASGLGLGVSDIKRGLASFGGVARRQQVRGVINDVTVVDDFAHHPTAVRETLAGLRGVHGNGRLWAVFEPRSSTSQRNVFQRQITEALAGADGVFVAPLFSAHKVPEQDRLDVCEVVKQLNASGTEAYSREIDQIVSHLAESCHPGDTVVVMSSGGFGGLIDKLLDALERRSI